jgi:serralysin
MAGGIANTASGIQNIDALLGLFHWSNVNLTYNFPTSASYYNASTYFTDGSVPAGPGFDFSTFVSVTPSLEAAIDKAIASELMAVAPLNYTKVASGADADSSFARASLFNDAEIGAPPGGLGYYPGAVDRGGDAWFNADQARFNNVQVGNSAYYVVLHELGHNVGLKHGHANDRPGPTTDILPYDLNSNEYSVMTYRRYVGAPDIPVAGDTQAHSFAQSLMMLDIQAIQYMYGADFTTNAGNTVYSFSTTTGEMFIDGVGQGTPAGNRIFRTIWDGDGIDTYNLSNYTSNLRIDLAPGGHSNFQSGQLAQLSIANNIFASGNVYNALQFNGDARSLIENATGGSGHDVIKGNAANNVLNGNAGNDALFGYDGNDTLNGGNGADKLSGGNGNDTLNGGSGNDSLNGGAGNDTLNGGVGNDNLLGGAGSDVLRGGDGADVLAGNAGTDELYGGLGNDTFDFRKAGGWDTIHDWQDFGTAQDVISFQGLGLDFSDLTVHYSGGDAIVYVTPEFGMRPTSGIIIENVLPFTIGASDFLF